LDASPTQRPTLVPGSWKRQCATKEKKKFPLHFPLFLLFSFFLWADVEISDIIQSIILTAYGKNFRMPTAYYLGPFSFRCGVVWVYISIGRTRTPVPSDKIVLELNNNEPHKCGAFAQGRILLVPTLKEPLDHGSTWRVMLYASTPIRQFSWHWRRRTPGVLANDIVVLTTFQGFISHFPTGTFHRKNFKTLKYWNHPGTEES
jgi:hypothetical protein